MRIWHYDTETLILIHSGESYADPDPLSPGMFLIPAGATPIAPIPEAEGKTRHYDKVSSVWFYRDEPPAPDAPPEPTETSLRESENACITSWRDAQEQSGFVFAHAGREWDGGLRVQARLQTAVRLVALPDGFFWTDAANEDIPVTPADVGALNEAHELALALRGWKIHERQRSLKSWVAQASRDELLDFEPGWGDAAPD